MNMLEQLKKYFEETPREQILKDWESTKEFDNVGITAEDFLKMQEQANGANTSDDKCHIQRVSNNEVALKAFLEWQQKKYAKPYDTSINEQIEDYKAFNDC